MPRVALTDRFVAGAKPVKGDTRTDYFDENVPGLALRAAKSGHKAWTFHFTSPRDGKRARHLLGTYPATTLAMARGLAIAMRHQVESGEDPRGVGVGTAELTFADLMGRYFADPDKAKLRSIGEIRRRLDKDVLPLIGAIRIAKLTRRDLRDVIERIAQRGAHRQAFLTFKDCQAVLRWSVRRDYLERNPMDGLDRPAGSTPRERVLSESEIRTLWKALPIALAKTETVQRAIKLALVTGQRIGEITGMARAEIDIERKLWSLPGARTKNGHPHHVPLSGLALDIVREALADLDDGADHLFPALSGGPIDPHVVGRAITRGRKRFDMAPWSAHDLRRSCLDGMARLGVAPHVIAHVANHRSLTKGGVTFAHYVHHTFEKEKRQALDLWADRLAAIVSGHTAEIFAMRAVSQ